MKWLLCGKYASQARVYSLSTYAIFSQKLTFLTSYVSRVRTCAYQGVRSVSFSENFAYVINEWSRTLNLKILCILVLPYFEVLFCWLGIFTSWIILILLPRSTNFTNQLSQETCPLYRYLPLTRKNSVTLLYNLGIVCVAGTPFNTWRFPRKFG